jgi:circadian clock protein KaiC
MDEVTGGGLLRGTTTLLAGPTGSGKTTMGLQFVLEGVRRGQPSLYVNFQENPTQLASALRALGTDVAAARARGLHLFYSSPVELQIDSVIVSVFRMIREKGIERVVVDAVGDLMSAASDTQRIQEYLYALVQHLAVRGVTCILNVEIPGGISALGSGLDARLSFMSDNIVLLEAQVGSSFRRTVVVVKCRATAHDLRRRDLEITASGASVRATD